MRKHVVVESGVLHSDTQKHTCHNHGGTVQL